jgi:hypothetical protein
MLLAVLNKKMFFREKVVFEVGFYSNLNQGG